MTDLGNLAGKPAASHRTSPVPAAPTVTTLALTPPCNPCSRPDMLSRQWAPTQKRSDCHLLPAHGTVCLEFIDWVFPSGCDR